MATFAPQAHTLCGLRLYYDMVATTRPSIDVQHPEFFIEHSTRLNHLLSSLPSRSHYGRSANCIRDSELREAVAQLINEARHISLLSQADLVDLDHDVRMFLGKVEILEAHISTYYRPALEFGAQSVSRKRRRNRDSDDDDEPSYSSVKRSRDFSALDDMEIEPTFCHSSSQWPSSEYDDSASTSASSSPAPMSWWTDSFYD